MNDRFVEIKQQIIKLEENDNKLINGLLPKTLVKIIKIEDLEKENNMFVKSVIYSVYSSISYDELVNGMVRDKYSESAEFAILRKAMTLKTDEFTEYNAYVEECKVKAREWINQRDGI